MTKGILASLLKQKAALSAPQGFEDDILDGADTRISSEIIRGTKLPTVVDSGQWMALFEATHRRKSDYDEEQHAARTSFSELELNSGVLKAIDEAGLENPTPIQVSAISATLAGRDVLCIGHAGTGKTASFILPMITALASGRARACMPRSLVLCPTRELAARVAEHFDTYSKYVKLTRALLVGGVSFMEQNLAIDKGVDVLIATPGRLLDHYERGKLNLSDVKVMVVDNAVEMLDLGFGPDIHHIFSLTPFTRQTLLFSGNMVPELERITNTFMSNPKRIEVARHTAAEVKGDFMPDNPKRKRKTDDAVQDEVPQTEAAASVRTGPSHTAASEKNSAGSRRFKNKA